MFRKLIAALAVFLAFFSYSEGAEDVSKERITYNEETGIFAMDSSGIITPISIGSGIDANATFPLGCITKMVTAYLAVENLQIDEYVSKIITALDFKKFVKSFSELDKRDIPQNLTICDFDGVAVSQLLTHNTKIEKDGFYYQNWNYALVGLILEKKTGKSYSDLVKDLCDKIGLSHTSVKGDPMAASGGIVSTPRDMLVFMKYLVDTGMLGHMSEQQYLVDKGRGKSYGLGLAIDKSVSAHLGIFRNSENFYYVTYLGYSSATKKYVVGYTCFKAKENVDYVDMFGASLTNHRNIRNCREAMDLIKDCRAQIDQ